MDRPKNQTSIAITAERHEESVSDGKGKQRNYEVFRDQG